MNSILTKTQKVSLVFLVLLYLNSVLFNTIAYLEHNLPNFDDTFRSIDAQLTFIKISSEVVSLFLLIFQSFLYIIILRIIKAKALPSFLRSLFYTVLSYLPFIIVSHFVFYFMGANELFNISQSNIFIIMNSILAPILYALFAFRDKIIDKYKLLLFSIILIVLNIIPMIVNLYS
ncbi:MAG: hypothetical protein IMX03_05340 [Brockia lithotrophica]|nr:hypothetical protein [Brockia lithotrophica]